MNSFRCGSQIVVIGDTKAEVLNTCGEPTSKEIIARDEKGYYLGNGFSKGEETIPKGIYRGVSRKVEEWYYNCGTYNFSYSLIFLGNELKSIEQVGYGKGESNCSGAGLRKRNEKMEENSPKLDRYLVKKLEILSRQLERPVDDLLEEAIEDIYKKYNPN